MSGYCVAIRKRKRNKLIQNGIKDERQQTTPAATTEEMSIFMKERQSLMCTETTKVDEKKMAFLSIRFVNIIIKL